MIKRHKWIPLAALTLFVTATSLFVLSQNQNDSVLAEVVVFHGGGFGSNVRTYHFIITNDGRLIAYHGMGRNRENLMRGRIIRRVHDRREVTLSEEDFRRIYGMIELAVENHDIDMTVLSMARVVLLHDGNIYDNQTATISRLSTELGLLSLFLIPLY